MVFLAEKHIAMKGTILGLAAALLVFTGCGKTSPAVAEQNDKPYGGIENSVENGIDGHSLTINADPQIRHPYYDLVNKPKPPTGAPYVTSGRINTDKKVTFKYGRLDARIKIPNLYQGLWPAFWLMDAGGDVYSVYNEIDILEIGTGWPGKNNQEKETNSLIESSLHYGPNVDTLTSTSNTTNIYGELHMDYRLYTMIWDENTIKTYVDLDKNPQAGPHFEVTLDNIAQKFVNREHYIILNLAAGGAYTNIPGDRNTEDGTQINKITALNAANNYEAKMYIDFVRIYNSTSNIADPDTLVWADEFNTGTVPNKMYWNIENNAVYNYELEWYTKDSVTIENDNLVITVRRHDPSSEE